MKIPRSQPIDLTEYINRIGDRVSRENFPDERVFEEPPEDEPNKSFRKPGPLPLFVCYEQPTHKQISYVLAGCCVVLLLILLAFAMSI